MAMAHSWQAAWPLEPLGQCQESVRRPRRPSNETPPRPEPAPASRRWGAASQGLGLFSELKLLCFRNPVAVRRAHRYESDARSV